MLTQRKPMQYILPVKLQPYRDEGAQGYLLRLAESNLLSTDELKSIGIIFDYDVLLHKGILVDETLDYELHRYVARISNLILTEKSVWNVQYARFCPHCLAENGYWRVEWELNFYDVCHHHQVWLVDQCSSCLNKVNWHRDQLSRCNCGSTLKAEQSKPCPTNMVDMARAISAKVLHNDSEVLPVVLQKTDVEQTQRLIRYLGNYMSLVAGKNPLKMRQSGDLNNSWPVTSLAAEVIADWPNAFHLALTKLEKQNTGDGRPSLNVVFGQAYHYVFKALKEKSFEELRRQFELWINQAWKGGIAKRNKRLTTVVMQQASWIPATLACDFLGISHQRLALLIREGALEGETHISDTGRKFTMVRRDNLQQIKDKLSGLIDMTTAGKLLGLQKRRMRKLLTLVFKEAKKLGTARGSPWAVSRLEVNRLLELSSNLEFVSIPDEGSVSLGHILRYWTWSNEDIAGLIISVKSSEINPTNLLDTVSGIAAWNFKESELRNWKLKNQNGMGAWLTISQAAGILGVKPQVVYELVSLNYLQAEIMPKQMKRGTRIRTEKLQDFKEKYIFATQIAELMTCSPRKVINHLASFGEYPISGPAVNGARQVLYTRGKVIPMIGNEL